jgi:hypothetical protein
MFLRNRKRGRVKKTIAVFAIGAAALTACSRPGSDERALQWTSELPAGSVVHLRNGSGSIEVKRSNSQSAQVIGNREWHHGRARDIEFVVTQNGNEYYVCAMWRNSGRCGANGYRGKNTGGFLSMFSLFHRSTDATAELVAELPANVIVDAKNTHGDVEVDGIAGGVTAKTTNGDVKATNVGGKVNLSTTNGDLVLEAEPSMELSEVTLNTTNGDIRAALPPGTQGLFDLTSSNGEVRSDFPLASTSKSRSNHLRGQIGAAARPVKMRSTNGDIVLTRGIVVDQH